MNKVSVFEPKDCRRTQELLDHFLAGELTVESNQEILQHLDHCSACQAEEKSRLEARRLLVEGWNSQPVPPALEDQVVAGLEARTRVLPPALRRVAGLVLMAMSIGAFALFFPWMSENTGLLMAVDHYEEVAADHVNCSGHPVPPSLVLPLDSVQARVEQAFRQVGGGYHLIERRICRIGGSPVFHYFFQGENTGVSVVLEERSEQEHLALEGNETQRVLHGVTVSLIRSNSLTLASFETPRYFVYLVVGQADPEEVLQLADRVLPSIQAAL